jgi:hypothetical protein
LIKEKGTGIGALELLVNKTTGSDGYEPGPDMMWNDGMMRYLKGSRGQTPGAKRRLAPGT